MQECIDLGLRNELDDCTVPVDNFTGFKRMLKRIGVLFKESMVMCSGFNTDYKSSEPLKTLVLLC